MSSSMSASTNLTAYFGHIVSFSSKQLLKDIRDGLLIVDENGVIVFVGEAGNLDDLGRDNGWASLAPRIRRKINYGNRLIMPGLVDTHLHLPQVTATARSGEHLMTWLERFIFPSEIRCQSQAYAERVARWFFDELARNGTTTGVVFTTIHQEATEIAFNVAAERGIRAIMGKVMMDANAPAELTEKLSESLKASEQLCQKWHGFDGGRLLYAFTPRFAPTSTSELLRECGKLWQGAPGTYLHTHLAESLDEVDFVKSQYPSARSYVDVYLSHGLLGKNTVMAHSIYLDDFDLRILKETDSSLAHCPSSNFFLKSGVFAYRRVEREGIRFGLGSDVGAGPQMTMFGVMKDANYMQSRDWLSPEELFYRATLAGAVALDLGHVIGSLEPGKDADFIVVDPTLRSAVNKDILERPTADILSALVFLGDDRVIEATFVRGRQIFDRQSEISDGHNRLNPLSEPNRYIERQEILNRQASAKPEIDV